MVRSTARHSTPARAALLAGVLLTWAAVCTGNAAPDKPSKEQPAERPDPWARLLERGWKQLDLVNYPAAEESFRKVRDGQPSRSQRAEALFALGHLWQYRRPGADIDKAVEHYRQVAGEFQDTPSSAMALMALACLADIPEYEKDRNVGEARRLYRRIIQEKAGSLAVHEAVLRLAMTYLEEGTDPNQSRGIRMITDHLMAHPDNVLAVAMHNQAATAYQARGEIARAVEQYVAADAADERAAEAELTDAERKLPLKRRLDQLAQNRVMDAGSRASLYFRIARLAEQKLKDYPLAVKWYARIVYEIVRDNKFYAAKLSAERCRELARQAGVQVPKHPLAGEGARP